MAVPQQLEWPYCPGTVQLVLQPIFVSKAIKVRGRWVLRGWQYGQHRLPLAIGVQTPSSAEYTLSVLPQDLEAAFRISAEPKRLLQRPHSAITPVVAIGLTAPTLALTDRPLELARPSFNSNSATASAAWHVFLALAARRRTWPRRGRNPHAYWRRTPTRVTPANRVVLAMQRVRDEMDPLRATPLSDGRMYLGCFRRALAAATVVRPADATGERRRPISKPAMDCARTAAFDGLSRHHVAS